MLTYTRNPEFQWRCQPYSCPIDYAKKCRRIPAPIEILESTNTYAKEDLRNPATSFNANCPKPNLEKMCTSTGYAPVRDNPGPYAFSVYKYNAQTQYGRPLYHMGSGWRYYDITGKIM